MDQAENIGVPQVAIITHRFHESRDDPSFLLKPLQRDLEVRNLSQDLPAYLITYFVLALNASRAAEVDKVQSVLLEELKLKGNLDRPILEQYLIVDVEQVWARPSV